MVKKLKITLTSTNKKILYFYKLFLLKFLKKFFIPYKSISLPIKQRKISLLTSPHVYKKAWEHFKSHQYKKVFIIKSSNLNQLPFLILKNKIKTINVKIKKYN